MLPDSGPPTYIDCFVSIVTTARGRPRAFISVAPLWLWKGAVATNTISKYKINFNDALKLQGHPIGAREYGNAMNCC